LGAGSHGSRATIWLQVRGPRDPEKDTLVAVANLVNMRKRVAMLVLILLSGCVDSPEARSGAAPEPSPSETVETEPEPSETAEPELELIDDGVISIRPKRVLPGATMTLAIRNPPGSWGLASFLDRKDGSEWTYIGGFRAGPRGQWKDHAFNRFYFLPKWRNVGIESVAFDGNDSIDLRVPRLEPGTYRIAHAFVVAREREWHVDVFEVIGP